MISGGLAGGGSSTPVNGSLRTSPPAPSAISTLFDRSFWGQRVLFIARSLIGTPYVWGGKDIEPGFDCSGFVHEVNELAGSKLPEGSAANQYNVCDTNKWLHSYDERMPGDIVWRDNRKHVGIYGGENTIEWPPASNNTTPTPIETVVHASGRPCSSEEDLCPNIVKKENCVGGNPACGKFRSVIESPLSVNMFGLPASMIGRPW